MGFQGRRGWLGRCSLRSSDQGKKSAVKEWKRDNDPCLEAKNRAPNRTLLNLSVRERGEKEEADT